MRFKDDILILSRKWVMPFEDFSFCLSQSEEMCLVFNILRRLDVFSS